MDLEQEKELVEKARNDTEAFGELYDQYYPQIFGYVLRRTASIEIAQDITSEVFFQGFEESGTIPLRWFSFFLMALSHRYQ